MATVFGLVLVASGLAVLFTVRPWRSDPDERDDSPPVAPPASRRGARPSPRARRRPRPGPVGGMDDDTVVLRRYRVDSIPRGRRVPAEPGRPEIPLPDWLGPVSGRH